MPVWFHPRMLYPLAVRGEQDRWRDIKFFAVRLRTIGPRERQEMDELIAAFVELPGIRQRYYTPSPFCIEYLEEILSGGGPERDLPPWLADIWAHENVCDDGIFMKHEFDLIMMHADLARLAYFWRKEESQFFRRPLKQAWLRVTLSLPESIQGLMEGEGCFISYYDEAVRFAQHQGGPIYLSQQGAFEALKARINLMNHEPTEQWLIDLESNSF